MSLSHTVEAYLGRKPDFLNEIHLQNDGAGDYIKEWGAVDKPEPTDSELESAKVEGDKIATLAKISNNRQAEYPSIQDVTVALAEKEEGDSTMWDEITAKRAAVKTKWPKDNSGPVE